MKADDVFNCLDLGVTARPGNLEFALAETQNAGRAKLANEPGKSRIQNGDRAKCALFHYYIVQLAYSYSASGECDSGFYQKMYLRESSAQKFADTVKGLPAFIRHSDKSPDLSTLLREDQQSVWPDMSRR